MKSDFSRSVRSKRQAQAANWLRPYAGTRGIIQTQIMMTLKFDHGHASTRTLNATNQSIKYDPTIVNSTFGWPLRWGDKRQPSWVSSYSDASRTGDQAFHIPSPVL